MDKKLKQELIDFLIFMDMTIMSSHQQLNIQGMMAIQELYEKYPQFNNRRLEVIKFIKLLKGE